LLMDRCDLSVRHVEFPMANKTRQNDINV